MVPVFKLREGVLSIKCDPEILDDLVWVLNRLLDVSKFLRNKARNVKSLYMARDPEKRRAQIAVFEKKAKRTYHRYCILRTSLSHSEALKALKKELSIGYYETEILIRYGKKIEKRELIERIASEHAAGMPIAELARNYNLSYKTVKRYCARSFDSPI